MEAKREKELVKQYSIRLKEEKARQKEVTQASCSTDVHAVAPLFTVTWRLCSQEKRKRREENLRRRAENEQKAEIVQVVCQQPFAQLNYVYVTFTSDSEHAFGVSSNL